MPVYGLPADSLIFPHPSDAEPDGLLAVGGDLSTDRLLLAYQNGIFPWNAAGEPILWWCITPRLVLKPEQVRITKSMRSYFNQQRYACTFDRDFLSVMLQCKTIDRRDQKGSWIHQELVTSFVKLHRMGIAHSVEVWDQDELIGGLYGLAIGKMFCGESMFARKPNASKFGLISLCALLRSKGFEWIDCQQDTSHLRSMGARLMERERFFEWLEENKQYPIETQSWLEESENSTQP